MNSTKTNKNLVAADWVSDTKTMTIWRKEFKNIWILGRALNFEISYVYGLKTKVLKLIY
jgi:hypothetical protein